MIHKKFILKVLAFGAALAVLIVWTACKWIVEPFDDAVENPTKATGEQEAPGTAFVTGVMLEPATLTIALNGTAKLTATVEPENAANKAVSWASGDPDKVAVDQEGNITGTAITGTDPVTITVTTVEGAFTATCAVAVKAVESIAVTTQPTKTTYNQYETLDLTGLVVTATLGDDSEETVSGWTSNPADGDALNAAGSQTITISYAGETVTFDITVHALQSITVSGPTKTTYNKDETLDLKGLVVTADFGAGGTTTVSDWTASPAHGYALDTVVSRPVAISYGEQTAEFTVSVYSVTVNLPAPVDGKVEQPLPGKTIFYGKGAEFTATVQGQGGDTPPQTVTWSLTGESLDSGTTIDNDGRLTVAPADHGKTLTVTATSSEVPGTYGTAQVTAVSVMPSALYGKWKSSIGMTDSIDAGKFSMTISYSYHEKALTSWEAAVGSGDNTYPVGYKLTGTQPAHNAFIDLADNLTIFLKNDGSAYRRVFGTKALVDIVYEKQP